MTRTRFHHLTVCLLCLGLCVVVQAQQLTEFTWQWWVMSALFGYASQPIINEFRARLGHMAAHHARTDPYRLVHPIAKG